MADWRYAADREARRGPHKFGISATDGLSYQSFNQLLVNAIDAGRHNQDGTIALNRPKYERLCNLWDSAANRRCRIGSRTRARVELHNGERIPKKGLHFAC